MNSNTSKKRGRKSIGELLVPETLALIKSLYDSGLYTHQTLADELNSRGISTASGRGRWHKLTVVKALKAANGVT